MSTLHLKPWLTLGLALFCLALLLKLGHFPGVAPYPETNTTPRAAASAPAHPSRLTALPEPP